MAQWLYDFPKAAATKYHQLGGLHQGPPTPGLRTSTGPRPVRDRAAQQEASSGERVKLHLYWRPLSRASIATSALPQLIGH